MAETTATENAGGIANWRGAEFETRLGVQYCVWMMLGEAAGLQPGALASAQIQAPQVVDDWVLTFESGDAWAIQAKGGALSVSWKPGSRFGKALEQLHDAAQRGQIDAAPLSHARGVLAIEHLAPSTVTSFAEWLDKARAHPTWPSLKVASTSSRERGYGPTIQP